MRKRVIAKYWIGKRALAAAAIFLVLPLSGASANPLAVREQDCRKLFEQISFPRLAAPLPFQQINHKIFGPEHEETVVLIHGLGGSMKTWHKLAERLANKYRVIIYDQRGHGLTPDVGDNYGAATMASDLASLLDGLHVKKVHLVGHSMGARTAVKFADLHPDRVASVTLEDMHVMDRRSQLEDPRPHAADVDKLSKLRFHSREDADHFLNDQMEVDDPERRNEMILESEIGFRLDVGTRAATIYSTHGLQEDLALSLSHIQAPVMAIQADPNHGAVLWGRGLTDFRAANPRAVVVGFTGANHEVHKSQPERFAEVLEEFLLGKTPPDSPLLYDLKK